jgi:methionyl-tRNA formyltransferase
VKKTFRIIFMGTPQFSVPGLTALHENAYDVAMVVTAQDRPKGRGRKMAPSAVKQKALELGYSVSQPASIKAAAFVAEVEDLKPDFMVVIAFGRILPENLLTLPRFGTINIHASLLPKYRGAAPIQWAIINGEEETGVCSMQMEKGLDTGNVLLCAKETIHPDDTAATLHDRLAVKSAAIIIDTLKAFADNRIQPVPQDHSLATYAPMLSKDDGLINWNQSAESLINFIRGVTPWPGAYTFIGDQRLKIFKSHSHVVEINESPGTVLEGFADELRVATANGALCVDEIQGESGKRMVIRDFLRGHKIPPGSVLG